MTDVSHRGHSAANSIAHVVALLGLFLSPLLVLPIFTNFMVTSKLLVIFVLALILVGLFIWHSLDKRVLAVPRSPLVVALVLFGLAMLASTFFSSSYPVENLLGLGGGYIAMVFIAILGGLLLKSKSAQDFQTVFNAAVIVLAVLTLAQTLGFGPSRFYNMIMPVLGLPNTSLFNVAGSPFLAAQIFGVAIVANAFTWIKTKKMEAINLVAGIAAVIGLFLSLPVILPGNEAFPILLPAGASWTVAIDVMKEPRSALVGVGPENYSSAYSIFKPLWINGQVWWNTTFGQGFDVPLTLLASSGLIGLVTWLVLTYRTAKQAREHLSHLPFIGGVLLATIVLQLVLPVNIVMLTIQAIALAFFMANLEPRKDTTIHLLKIDRQPDFLPFNLGEQTKRGSTIGSVFPLLVAVLIAGSGLYLVGRAYAASYSFFQSSIALQTNDGVKVYELQQRATQLNPFVAGYRSNYALTNLAIATALANKTDLTPQEQEQIGALIQQAIQEARAATVLRPTDYQTWQVLARIYQNLIGSAEGADQWAISAYVQAINNNPNDPLLRIELGGIFYSAQQYDQAISLFSQAAELKPDLPNAYYNLANALKSAGRLAEAQQVYQQTLALLPADSSEYIQANQELEEVQAAIAEQGEANAEATDETAAPTSQESLPSLVDENISGDSNELVTQPGNQNLTVTEQAPAVSPEPSASPSPNP